MQLTESTIFIGLNSLRKKLYAAQFLMDKSARIIYGTPLMESSAHTLRYFTMAFTIKEKKAEYLDEAIGWFSVLRNDLQFCVMHNIIHYRHQEDEVSSQKIELFKIVAKIDEEMCKWRVSLAKGKNIAA